MNHKYPYERKLGMEAVAVGVGLIPVYLITEKVVKQFKASEFTTKIWTLFLSGMYFHLLAEGTGVNKWYLSNSAAELKMKLNDPIPVEHRSNDQKPMHMCKGNCGWYETQGLFPHEIFHA
jgi:hypothetical protein